MGKIRKKNKSINKGSVRDRVPPELTPYDIANNMLDDLYRMYREEKRREEKKDDKVWTEFLKSRRINRKQRRFNRYLRKHLAFDEELAPLLKKMPRIWWKSFLRLEIIYWLSIVVLFFLNEIYFHIYTGFTYTHAGATSDMIYFLSTPLVIYIYSAQYNRPL